MKLTCDIYICPDPSKGEFRDAVVEETCITHQGKEKRLEVKFDMYYMKNDEKVNIGTRTMLFYGMENDTISSNQTTYVRIANPNYDPEVDYTEEIPNPDWYEGSDLPEFITVDNTPPQTLVVPLFKPDGSYNVPSMDFEVVEYGYPTYEKALQMFEGGSFEQPEIIVTEPLAIGFILNKLIINGEPVGIQFQFENVNN